MDNFLFFSRRFTLVSNEADYYVLFLTSNGSSFIKVVFALVHRWNFRTPCKTFQKHLIPPPFAHTIETFEERNAEIFRDALIANGGNISAGKHSRFIYPSIIRSFVYPSIIRHCTICYLAESKT